MQRDADAFWAFYGFHTETALCVCCFLIGCGCAVPEYNIALIQIKSIRAIEKRGSTEAEEDRISESSGASLLGRT